MKKILCLCFSAVLVLMCVACANQTTVMVSDPVGQADVTTAGVTDPETTEGETDATTHSSASERVTEAKTTTKKTKATTVSSPATEKVTEAKTTTKKTATTVSSPATEKATEATTARSSATEKVTKATTTRVTTTKKTTYIPPLPVLGDPLSLQPVRKQEVCCWSDTMLPTATLCRSVDDLDALSNLTDRTGEKKMSLVLKEAYGDAFFADKALLVLYFYESDGGITGSVESLSLDGSTLRANVALERLDSLTKNLAYTQAIKQWLWVYELPADVAAAATDAAVQVHNTVRYTD